MRKCLTAAAAGLLACYFAFCFVFAADGALRGDVDQNGRVNTSDARLILRHAVSLDSLPEEMVTFADVDSDGSLKTADARLALRMAVGLEELFTMDEVYHAHAYVELERTDETCTADGQRLLRCQVCGKEKTEVLPARHIYQDATCTTPRTCTRCGATTGSALGHTTGLGICGNCGQEILDLMDEMDAVLSQYNSAVEYIDMAYGALAYGDLAQARSCYNQAGAAYAAAAELCGSYWEFQTIKPFLSQLSSTIYSMSQSMGLSQAHVDAFNGYVDQYVALIESFQTEVTNRWGDYYYFEE